MDRETPGLTVSISERARRKLKEIWDWNAARYDPAHADEYLAFLIGETRNLLAKHVRNRVVPSDPSIRYGIIRRARKGHGHVVVYELVDNVFNVLDYFHSAQDWQNEFAKSRQ